MAETEQLIKTTVGEIERVLTTKSVVGEPQVVEGNTLIPLVSIGFGFGAGAGTGSSKRAGEGGGSGGGGAGGVKPVAVIVVDKSGAVRIEPIKGGLASAIEKAIEKCPEMMHKMRQRKEEEKEEKQV